MAVLLIVLLLYLPATLRCGFVHIDDPEYVLNNLLIRQLDLETVISAFTQTPVGWWMPLTWLSFAIDYQFWGLKPSGYHLTNIILHALNAALVVLIADRLLQGLRELSDERGEERGYLYPVMLLFAGLFFGIHPLRVESVAWVTERKDVLNGLFFFGAVLSYLRFARQKQVNPRGTGYGGYYLLSLGCFLLSLMAKSTSVVLPAMLLTLDCYPLGRLGRNTLRPVLLEKLPFFAASAAMVAITLLTTASSQYLVTYQAFPFTQRLVVSGNAVWEYFRMLLFPYGLSPFNVIPDPIPAAYTLTTLVVAAALLCIAFAARQPWLKAAAVCFVLPMLPVLAFFQNGDQSFADRFTYLPSLAFTVAAAGILFTLASTRKGIAGHSLVLFGTAVLVVVLSIMTYRQISVWRSTETFWTRVISIEPLAISYKERGRYYHMIGRYDAAIADYTAALERITATLKPYEYNFYAFRAESLRVAGRFEEAIRDYSTAIGMYPHPAYFLGRGLSLRALGRGAEADEDIRRSGTNPGPVVWFD
jgi:tetratricopeptide (TPR) repeat protein